MDKTPKPSGTRRRFVITPDQIAKLGLTAKLQSVIAPQLTKQTATKNAELKKSRSQDESKTENATKQKAKTRKSAVTKKSSKIEEALVGDDAKEKVSLYTKSRLRQKILENSQRDSSTEVTNSAGVLEEKRKPGRPRRSLKDIEPATENTTQCPKSSDTRVISTRSLNAKKCGPSNNSEVVHSDGSGSRTEESDGAIPKPGKANKLPARKLSSRNKIVGPSTNDSKVDSNVSSDAGDATEGKQLVVKVERLSVSLKPSVTRDLQKTPSDEFDDTPSRVIHLPPFSALKQKFSNTINAKSQHTVYHGEQIADSGADNEDKFETVNVKVFSSTTKRKPSTSQTAPIEECVTKPQQVIHGEQIIEENKNKSNTLNANKFSSTKRQQPTIEEFMTTSNPALLHTTNPLNTDPEAENKNKSKTLNAKVFSSAKRKPSIEETATTPNPTLRNVTNPLPNSEKLVVRLVEDDEEEPVVGLAKEEETKTVQNIRRKFVVGANEETNKLAVATLHKDGTHGTIVLIPADKLTVMKKEGSGTESDSGDVVLESSTPAKSVEIKPSTDVNPARAPLRESSAVEPAKKVAPGKVVILNQEMLRKYLGTENALKVGQACPAVGVNKPKNVLDALIARNKSVVSVPNEITAQEASTVLISKEDEDNCSDEKRANLQLVKNKEELVLNKGRKTPEGNTHNVYTNKRRGRKGPVVKSAMSTVQQIDHNKAYHDLVEATTHYFQTSKFKPLNALMNEHKSSEKETTKRDAVFEEDRETALTEGSCESGTSTTSVRVESNAEDVFAATTKDASARNKSLQVSSEKSNSKVRNTSKILLEASFEKNTDPCLKIKENTEPSENMKIAASKIEGETSNKMGSTSIALLTELHTPPITYPKTKLKARLSSEDAESRRRSSAASKIKAKPTVPSNKAATSRIEISSDEASKIQDKPTISLNRVSSATSRIEISSDEAEIHEPSKIKDVSSDKLIISSCKVSTTTSRIDISSDQAEITSRMKISSDEASSADAEINEASKIEDVSPDNTLVVNAESPEAFASKYFTSIPKDITISTGEALKDKNGKLSNASGTSLTNKLGETPLPNEEDSNGIQSSSKSSDETSSTAEASTLSISTGKREIKDETISSRKDVHEAPSSIAEASTSVGKHKIKDKTISSRTNVREAPSNTTRATEDQDEAKTSIKPIDGATQNVPAIKPGTSKTSSTVSTSDSIDGATQKVPTPGKTSTSCDEKDEIPLVDLTTSIDSDETMTRSPASEDFARESKRATEDQHETTTSTKPIDGATQKIPAIKPATSSTVPTSDPIDGATQKVPTIKPGTSKTSSTVPTSDSIDGATQKVPTPGKTSTNCDKKDEIPLVDLTTSIDSDETMTRSPASEDFARESKRATEDQHETTTSTKPIDGATQKIPAIKPATSSTVPTSDPIDGATQKVKTSTSCDKKDEIPLVDLTTLIGPDERISETTVSQSASGDFPPEVMTASPASEAFPRGSKPKSLCDPVVGKTLKRRRIPNKPTVVLKRIKFGAANSDESRSIAMEIAVKPRDKSEGGIEASDDTSRNVDAVNSKSIASEVTIIQDGGIEASDDKSKTVDAANSRGIEASDHKSKKVDAANSKSISSEVTIKQGQLEIKKVVATNLVESRRPVSEIAIAEKGGIEDPADCDEDGHVGVLQVVKVYAVKPVAPGHTVSEIESKDRSEAPCLGTSILTSMSEAKTTMEEINRLGISADIKISSKIDQSSTSDKSEASGLCTSIPTSMSQAKTNMEEINRHEISADIKISSKVHPSSTSDKSEAPGLSTSIFEAKTNKYMEDVDQPDVSSNKAVGDLKNSSKSDSFKIIQSIGKTDLVSYPEENVKPQISIEPIASTPLRKPASTGAKLDTSTPNASCPPPPLKFAGGDESDPGSLTPIPKRRNRPRAKVRCWSEEVDGAKHEAGEVDRSDEGLALKSREGCARGSKQADVAENFGRRLEFGGSNYPKTKSENNEDFKAKGCELFGKVGDEGVVDAIVGTSKITEVEGEDNATRKPRTGYIEGTTEVEGEDNAIKNPSTRYIEGEDNIIKKPCTRYIEGTTEVESEDNAIKKPVGASNSEKTQSVDDARLVETDLADFGTSRRRTEDAAAEATKSANNVAATTSKRQVGRLLKITTNAVDTETETSRSKTEDSELSTVDENVPETTTTSIAEDKGVPETITKSKAEDEDALEPTKKHAAQESCKKSNTRLGKGIGVTRRKTAANKSAIETETETESIAITKSKRQIGKTTKSAIVTKQFEKDLNAEAPEQQTSSNEGIATTSASLPDSGNPRESASIIRDTFKPKTTEATAPNTSISFARMKRRLSSVLNMTAIKSAADAKSSDSEASTSKTEGTAAGPPTNPKALKSHTKKTSTTTWNESVSITRCKRRSGGLLKITTIDTIPIEGHHVDSKTSKDSTSSRCKTVEEHHVDSKTSKDSTSPRSKTAEEHYVDSKTSKDSTSSRSKTVEGHHVDSESSRDSTSSRNKTFEYHVDSKTSKDSTSSRSKTEDLSTERNIRPVSTRSKIHIGDKPVKVDEKTITVVEINKDTKSLYALRLRKAKVGSEEKVSTENLNEDTESLNASRLRKAIEGCERKVVGRAENLESSINPKTTEDLHNQSSEVKENKETSIITCLENIVVRRSLHLISPETKETETSEVSHDKEHLQATDEKTSTDEEETIDAVKFRKTRNLKKSKFAKDKEHQDVDENTSTDEEETTDAVKFRKTRNLKKSKFAKDKKHQAADEKTSTDEEETIDAAKFRKTRNPKKSKFAKDIGERQTNEETTSTDEEETIDAVKLVTKFRKNRKPVQTSKVGSPRRAKQFRSSARCRKCYRSPKRLRKERKKENDAKPTTLSIANIKLLLQEALALPPPKNARKRRPHRKVDIHLNKDFVTCTCKKGMKVKRLLFGKKRVEAMAIKASPTDGAEQMEGSTSGKEDIEEGRSDQNLLPKTLGVVDEAEPIEDEQQIEKDSQEDIEVIRSQTTSEEVEPIEDEQRIEKNSQVDIEALRSKSMSEEVIEALRSKSMSEEVIKALRSKSMSEEVIEALKDSQEDIEAVGSQTTSEEIEPIEDEQRIEKNSQVDIEASRSKLMSEEVIEAIRSQTTSEEVEPTEDEQRFEKNSQVDIEASRSKLMSEEVIEAIRSQTTSEEVEPTEDEQCFEKNSQVDIEALRSKSMSEEIIEALKESREDIEAIRSRTTSEEVEPIEDEQRIEKNSQVDIEALRRKSMSEEVFEAKRSQKTSEEAEPIEDEQRFEKNSQVDIEALRSKSMSKEVIEPLKDSQEDIEAVRSQTTSEEVFEAIRSKKTSEEVEPIEDNQRIGKISQVDTEALRSKSMSEEVIEALKDSREDVEAIRSQTTSEEVLEAIRSQKTSEEVEPIEDQQRIEENSQVDIEASKRKSMSEEVIEALQSKTMPEEVIEERSGEEIEPIEEQQLEKNSQEDIEAIRSKTTPEELIEECSAEEIKSKEGLDNVRQNFAVKNMQEDTKCARSQTAEDDLNLLSEASEEATEDFSSASAKVFCTRIKRILVVNSEPKECATPEVLNRNKPKKDVDDAITKPTIGDDEIVQNQDAKDAKITVESKEGACVRKIDTRNEEAAHETPSSDIINKLKSSDGHSGEPITPTPKSSTLETKKSRSTDSDDPSVTPLEEVGGSQQPMPKTRVLEAIILEPATLKTSDTQATKSKLKAGLTVVAVQCVTAGVSDGETGGFRSPIEGASRPPTEDASIPPIEGASRPPIEGASRPLIEGALRTLIEDASIPPTEDASRPPTEGASRPPTEGASIPPIEGASRPPIEGALRTLIEGASIPPIEGALRPPIEGASRLPIEGASRPPTEGASRPPTEGASIPPIEGALRPPTEGASRPPTEGASIPPIEGALRPPIEAASRPPIECASRPPIEGMLRPPIEGASKPSNLRPRRRRIRAKFRELTASPKKQSSPEVMNKTKSLGPEEHRGNKVEMNEPVLPQTEDARLTNTRRTEDRSIRDSTTILDEDNSTTQVGVVANVPLSSGWNENVSSSSEKIDEDNLKIENTCAGNGGGDSGNKDRHTVTDKDEDQHLKFEDTFKDREAQHVNIEDTSHQKFEDTLIDREDQVNIKDNPHLKFEDTFKDKGQHVNIKDTPHQKFEDASKDREGQHVNIEDTPHQKFESRRNVVKRKPRAVFRREKEEIEPTVATMKSLPSKTITGDTDKQAGTITPKSEEKANSKHPNKNEEVDYSKEENTKRQTVNSSTKEVVKEVLTITRRSEENTAGKANSEDPNKNEEIEANPKRKTVNSSRKEEVKGILRSTPETMATRRSCRSRLSSKVIADADQLPGEENATKSYEESVANLQVGYSSSDIRDNNNSKKIDSQQKTRDSSTKEDEKGIKRTTSKGTIDDNAESTNEGKVQNLNLQSGNSSMKEDTIEEIKTTVEVSKSENIRQTRRSSSKPQSGNSSTKEDTIEEIKTTVEARNSANIRQTRVSASNLQSKNSLMKEDTTEEIETTVEARNSENIRQTRGSSSNLKSENSSMKEDAIEEIESTVEARNSENIRKTKSSSSNMQTEHSSMKEDAIEGIRTAIKAKNSENIRQTRGSSNVQSGNSSMKEDTIEEIKTTVEVRNSENIRQTRSSSSKEPLKLSARNEEFKTPEGEIKKINTRGSSTERNTKPSAESEGIKNSKQQRIFEEIETTVEARHSENIRQTRPSNLQSGNSSMKEDATEEIETTIEARNSGNIRQTRSSSSKEPLKLSARNEEFKTPEREIKKIHARSSSIERNAKPSAESEGIKNSKQQRIFEEIETTVEAKNSENIRQTRDSASNLQVENSSMKEDRIEETETTVEARNSENIRQTRSSSSKQLLKSYAKNEEFKTPEGEIKKINTRSSSIERNTKPSTESEGIKTSQGIKNSKQQSGGSSMKAVAETSAQYEEIKSSKQENRDSSKNTVAETSAQYEEIKSSKLENRDSSKNAVAEIKSSKQQSGDSSMRALTETSDQYEEIKSSKQEDRDSSKNAVAEKSAQYEEIKSSKQQSGDSSKNAVAETSAQFEEIKSSKQRSGDSLKKAVAETSAQFEEIKSSKQQNKASLKKAVAETSAQFEEIKSSKQQRDSSPEPAAEIRSLKEMKNSAEIVTKEAEKAHLSKEESRTSGDEAASTDTTPRRGLRAKPRRARRKSITKPALDITVHRRTPCASPLNNEDCEKLNTAVQTFSSSRTDEEIQDHETHVPSSSKLANITVHRRTPRGSPVNNEDCEKVITAVQTFPSSSADEEIEDQGTNVSSSGKRVNIGVALNEEINRDGGKKETNVHANILNEETLQSINQEDFKDGKSVENLQSDEENSDLSSIKYEDEEFASDGNFFEINKEMRVVSSLKKDDSFSTNTESNIGDKNYSFVDEDNFDDELFIEPDDELLTDDSDKDDGKLLIDDDRLLTQGDHLVAETVPKKSEESGSVCSSSKILEEEKSIPRRKRITRPKITPKPSEGNDAACATTENPGVTTTTQSEDVESKEETADGMERQLAISRILQRSFPEETIEGIRDAVATTVESKEESADGMERQFAISTILQQSFPEETIEGIRDEIQKYLAGKTRGKPAIGTTEEECRINVESSAMAHASKSSEDVEARQTSTSSEDVEARQASTSSDVEARQASTSSEDIEARQVSLKGSIISDADLIAILSITPRREEPISQLSVIITAKSKEVMNLPCEELPVIEDAQMSSDDLIAPKQIEESKVAEESKSLIKTSLPSINPTLKQKSHRRKSLEPIVSVCILPEDNSAEETCETPTPKRRGRPKKSVQPLVPSSGASPLVGKRKRAAINYAHLNEGLDEDSVSKKTKIETKPGDEIAAPKRRGRRKKVNIPIPDEEMDQTISDVRPQPSEITPKLVEKKSRKSKTKYLLVLKNEEILVTATSDISFTGDADNPQNASANEESVNLQNTSANEESPAPKRRKTGRPRKVILGEENMEISPTLNEYFDNSTPKTEEPVVAKKRGRKKKEEAESGEDTTPRKRDRGSAKKLETGEAKKKLGGHIDVQGENETLYELQNRLLVRNFVYEMREEMARAKIEDDGLKVVTGSVKCAVCMKILKTNEWFSHKQKRHNNLAWAVGEPELDLNNVSFVINTLSRIYARKKPLCCHKCNESKKSVIGFLGHVLQCQRSGAQLEAFKIQCAVCSVRTMPYSFAEHMKWHRIQEERKIKAAAETDQIQDEEACVPGRKREAAKRASYLIQTVSNEANEADRHSSKRYYTIKKEKIADSEYENYISKEGDGVLCAISGCNNESKNLEEALEHFKTCKSSEENRYCCKFCECSFKNKPEFDCHFEKVHSETADDSDFDNEGTDHESDGELQQLRPKRIKTAASADGSWQSYQLKFLYEAVYIKGISLYLNHWCYSKHLEFCEENYKNDFNLFANVETKWTLLDKGSIKDYLPKLKQSMRVNSEVSPQGTFSDYYKGNEPFKKYKLFESTLQKAGYDIIFCGGPISSMSWVPTPHTKDDCQQILAISVIPDPDKGYSVAQIYDDKSIIQFWNVGILDINTGIATAPKLEFCLAHGHGPIWAMEWCPSGCYRDDELGVVAVGGSDSLVYGYRIPQPEVLSGIIYEADPIFKLIPSKVTDFNVGGHSFYASRISWSKSSGHQHVCVGYSNGVVSVFDLDPSSEQLKTEQGGVVVYYPYVTFQGHNAAVTGVALYHMNGGNKWLATASYDRTVKFWNLEDVGWPISLKKKIQIKEFVWMNNWISTVDAHDDWSNPMLQTTSLTQLREFAAQHCNTVMYSYSSVNSISASDWGNIIVQGNLTGELIGCYVKHLLPFTVEVPAKRFFMSYTKLLPNEGVNIKENIDRNGFYDYKTTTDNTSLVFVDFDLKCYKKVMKPSEACTSHRGAYEQVRMDMYPVQSITNVKVNPNRHCFLYTAVGYQTGFVRLIHSKFLSTKM